ncbi:MAG: hypothetical protein Ct9H90mP9_3900 [Pseudomonadota bacterium]|nr:MAG: hypothetical protein Ct9H90mP9_3900 [Pseudomonadota bacterium]
MNHPLGKNTIGAFKQPNHVSMGLEFLKTLPSRELPGRLLRIGKAGLTMTGNCLIFFKEGKLEPLDLNFLEEAVFRSCRVKARIGETGRNRSRTQSNPEFWSHPRSPDRNPLRLRNVSSGEAVGNPGNAVCGVSLKTGTTSGSVFLGKNPGVSGTQTSIRNSSQTGL